jgi:hypothetical protein
VIEVGIWEMSEDSLLALLDEEAGQRFPDLFVPRRRGREKAAVASYGV